MPGLDKLEGAALDALLNVVANHPDLLEKLVLLIANAVVVKVQEAVHEMQAAKAQPAK